MLFWALNELFKITFPFCWKRLWFYETRPFLLRFMNITLLKMGLKPVSSPIAKLINLSDVTGQSSSLWETAKVTALHRAGGLSDVNKNHPISVFQVLSKSILRHDMYTINCLSLSL